MHSVSIEQLKYWQKQYSTRKHRLKELAFGSGLPAGLVRNFRPLSVDQTEALMGSLNRHYFSAYNKSYFNSQAYPGDLLAHVILRVDENRLYKIPWLDSTRSLHGLEILEIGCGTGCSTVALAEQGARVTAIDVDEASIAVARERCRIYGLDVELAQVNAAELGKHISPGRFQMIIFYSTLEHLTYKERLQALQSSWDLLSPGGLLGITGTPNRLWFFDSHTAQLPFFHWLPDELAILYTQFSDRKQFREDFISLAKMDHLRFMRWGRGMSFHELELAICPLAQMKIRDSLVAYRSRKYPLAMLMMNLSREYRNKSIYRKGLSRIYPDIDPVFFQENIDVLIEKTAG